MQKTIALSLLALLAGCSKPEVKYDDPNKVETVNEDYGRTDLKMIVDQMVKDMNDCCKRNRIFADGEGLGARPFIALRTIENAVPDEFIDTKQITEKIRNAVLNSGLYRFTVEQQDKADTLETKEEVEQSGLYKTENTGKKWNPPQLLLRGRISSIKKSNEDVKDVYYLVSLRLDTVQTAETVWTGEKEINKRVAK